MSQPSIYWDSETAPLPEERLKQLYKPKTYEEFAESCNKTWKPETVQKKFDEYQVNGFAEFVESAALSPVTGRVCLIGLCAAGKVSLIEGDEKEVLAKWWECFVKFSKAKREMIGLNIFGFDLPFLVRRSWINSIDIPAAAITRWKGRINWHDLFIDIRNEWLLGQSWGDTKSSLDHIAAALGLEGKLAGVQGADFGKLYFGSEEDREKARDYAKQDVLVTAAIGERIGVGVAA